MSSHFTRRRFFRTTAATGTLLGLGDFTFLSRLPAVSAAEAKLDPKAVAFHPEIEPLVRLLEDTPRERLLEEVAARIQRGLSYGEVLTALLLAGVRNVQPRPVGFKFHAVLVVNSAHLASLAAPDSDRWLPIFWALDYFKNSQERDVKEGNWTMGPVDEPAVPPSHKARQAFKDAMNSWDEAAADVAVVGLARTARPEEIFELFCRFGARDFRDIGHKAIYVANSWRTLQVIGWQHAEPVLRSLAYALLDHEGANPARRDGSPDRPWRRNQELALKIKSGWLNGKASESAASDLLETLRNGTAESASEKVVNLLNRGAAPQSLWDALLNCAAELLMRRRGIVALHAVTCTNALHFAFQASANDETRRLLLLQNAAFLPLFRGDPKGLKDLRIDEIIPASPKGKGPKAVEEIFAEINADTLLAARKTLAYLQEDRDPAGFIHAARRLVFLKGRDAHDYKFSSAVLEDYQRLSPVWRDRYLAASVFNLRGSSSEDNDLVKRTRAALKG